ncbi:MAG TPA: DMT family transporter, partial [Anaerolineales bacterium]|nr:DMT family transporter [Anaerolineales bacterium]
AIISHPQNQEQPALPSVFRPQPPSATSSITPSSSPTAKTYTDWQAVGLVALGAVCYSSVIIFTRQSQGLSALSVSFFRAFFGFVFSSLLLLILRQPVRWSALKPYWKLLLLQSILMSGAAILYVYSVQHTTAANAALLVNSAPIYVALLAPLVLKERSPRYTRLSLVLILAGVVLLTGVLDQNGGVISWPGLIAGFFAGANFGGVVLVSRAQHGQVPGLIQTWIGTAFASLLLLPWGLSASGELVSAYLPSLVGLGVLSYGLPSFLYFVSLQRLKAQVVSVVALLEPVAGALIGMLVYQEMFTLAALAGSLLVLVSIYLIAQE